MKRSKKCSNCRKFGECKTLCVGAEKYAAQDEISQREETIGIPMIIKPANLSVGAPISLTSRELEIVTLMELHAFSRKETAQFLKISMKNLKTNLYRIRKKISPPED